MTQEELFSSAIGIKSPWFITSIDLDLELGTLNIFVDFEKGSTFDYTDWSTGEKGSYKAYDTVPKNWRHMNFFQYRCYLHAFIPRVKLPNGKVRQIKAGWEGTSSGFTLLFEAFILQLVKAMPVHQVCEMIGTYDAKLWKMLHCYRKQVLAQADYSEVENIGMDETAARRGHDYVSLVVDLDEKKTIFVTEGKSNEVVEEFSQDLIKHKGDPENIKNVSCDMSPAFIKGVEDHLPNADIVFDKFHITKLINKAVDEVRKEENKSNSILKGSKYYFFEKQRKSNRKTGKTA